MFIYIYMFIYLFACIMISCTHCGLPSKKDVLGRPFLNQRVKPLPLLLQVKYGIPCTFRKVCLDFINLNGSCHATLQFSSVRFNLSYGSGCNDGRSLSPLWMVETWENIEIIAHSFIMLNGAEICPATVTSV